VADWCQRLLEPDGARFAMTLFDGESTLAPGALPAMSSH
jgi:hypothetical protein